MTQEVEPFVDGSENLVRRLWLMLARMIERNEFGDIISQSLEINKGVEASRGNDRWMMNPTVGGARYKNERGG